MYDRYAIYFTPEGALADLGAAWLGWDVARGEPTAHPSVDGVDVAEVTQTPRKYGMHGTIKPPLYLAKGTSAEGLRDAAHEVCQTLAPVKLDALELAALGRFLALVPREKSVALAELAGRVVTGLDRFRAPPSETELAKRRGANLTPEQEAHLVRWGYPYVLEQFKFHITLTSKLSKARVHEVHEAIQPMFAPHLGPLLVDSLTLVGQRPDGMFEEIERFRFAG